MSFIQIIEYKTRRIDELNTALDAWLEKTKGKRASTRGVQTRDRDAENTYLQIVEFPSHDEAMANSQLPETAEFAAQLLVLDPACGSTSGVGGPQYPSLGGSGR